MADLADLTGTNLGGYRILRKLGQGGMAVVYKAHEESLNRQVALKVIAQHLSADEQFITRFRREAQAAAQLSHPNIVQIYAIGEDDGVHYFSMEYVKGQSLSEIIAEEGFLTAGRAVPIIAQAAEALAAAHDAGIVHRDIKPANIMLDPAGRVKVADFGIAQMSTETRMTQSGMLVGTPEFISPEQCHSEKLDGRSDIYSLGVTLYQLLSGRTPFQADTPASLVLQIVEGPKTPLGEINPTVSAEVQQIVAKMMHVDRDQRFQSADDLVDALRSADTRPITSPTLQSARGVAPIPVGDAATTVPDPGAMAPTGATADELPPTVVRTAELEAETEIASPATVPAGNTAKQTEPAASPPPATPPTKPAASASATAAAPPTTPTSPAAEAYAGKSGGSKGALLGLAAVVLIVATVALFAWQMMGDSSAQDAGNNFDPVTDARSQPLPEPQSKDADTSGAGSDASSTAGDETADDSATASGAETTEDTATAGAVEAAEIPAAATSDPPADVGTASTSGSTSAATQDPVTSTAGQAAPPATDTPAATPQPAIVAPPINSIVAETSGEYEYVEQVHAWIERSFGGQRFEVVDFASSPYNSLQEAARFHVVTTARLVGTEQLQYFGNVQTQYTVSLTSRVIDLTNGATVVGPESDTIQYTSTNMQQNLERGTNELARAMARQLRQVIQRP